MANTIKILLSEQNERIIESMRDYFSHKPVEIYFCSKNGKILLDCIRKYTPDVVMCDVFMSEFDAISVKEKASVLENPPELFLITSSYDNDDIIKRTLTAGFNYYFIKPYSPEIVYDRILSIFKPGNLNVNTSVIDMYISRLLHKFEMPSHLKGYNYVHMAIKLVIAHPGYINNVTKKLYPEIARKFNTTASRVERSIRTAVETAWNRAPMEVKEMYFSYYALNYIKPSNSEFIAYISDIVRNTITFEKMS